MPVDLNKISTLNHFLLAQQRLPLIKGPTPLQTVPRAIINEADARAEFSTTRIYQKAIGNCFDRKVIWRKGFRLPDFLNTRREEARKKEFAIISKEYATSETLDISAPGANGEQIEARVGAIRGYYRQKRHIFNKTGESIGKTIDQCETEISGISDEFNIIKDTREMYSKSDHIRSRAARMPKLNAENRKLYLRAVIAQDAVDTLVSNLQNINNGAIVNNDGTLPADGVIKQIDGWLDEVAKRYSDSPEIAKEVLDEFRERQHINAVEGGIFATEAPAKDVGIIRIVEPGARALTFSEMAATADAPADTSKSYAVKVIGAALAYAEKQNADLKKSAQCRDFILPIQIKQRVVEIDDVLEKAKKLHAETMLSLGTGEEHDYENAESFAAHKARVVQRGEELARIIAEMQAYKAGPLSLAGFRKDRLNARKNFIKKTINDIRFSKDENNALAKMGWSVILAGAEFAAYNYAPAAAASAAGAVPFLGLLALNAVAVFALGALFDDEG